jgi:hypothetical protein
MQNRGKLKQKGHNRSKTLRITRGGNTSFRKGVGIKISVLDQNIGPCLTVLSELSYIGCPSLAVLPWAAFTLLAKHKLPGPPLHCLPSIS